MNNTIWSLTSRFEAALHNEPQMLDGHTRTREVLLHSVRIAEEYEEELAKRLNEILREIKVLTAEAYLTSGSHSENSFASGHEHGRMEGYKEALKLVGALRMGLSVKGST